MARTISQAIDRTLLQALACGATVEHAAHKAGLCERTVYRRLADAGFCLRLRQLRTEMVQRTAAMLTGAGLGSVKTLLSLQSDVAVSASVRRRAARDILDLGIKFREIDELEQRLAAVEGRLEGTVHDTPENQGESAFARTPEEDLVDGAAEAVRDDTESDGLGTPA